MNSSFKMTYLWFVDDELFIGADVSVLSFNGCLQFSLQLMFLSPHCGAFLIQLAYLLWQQTSVMVRIQARIVSIGDRSASS